MSSTEARGPLDASHLTKEDVGKACVVLKYKTYTDGTRWVDDDVDVEGFIAALADDGNLVKVGYQTTSWLGFVRTLYKWVPADTVAVIEVGFSIYARRPHVSADPQSE